MKKQKLLTIFFCCALLIGVSSVAANAQELAGTTYTLFIYPAGQASFNADVNFLENGVTQIGIADSAGAGSYYEVAPSFLASYRALGVTLGETTGDLSLYMLGTTLSEGELMIGLGVALFTVTDSNVPFTTFWFYGRLTA